MKPARADCRSSLSATRPPALQYRDRLNENAVSTSVIESLAACFDRCTTRAYRQKSSKVQPAMEMWCNPTIVVAKIPGGRRKASAAKGLGLLPADGFSGDG